MKAVVQAAVLAACVAAGIPPAGGHAPSQGDVSAPPGAPATAPAGPFRQADRTFHPDYTHALSVEQMQRAWRDELERIDPPVVTGGG